MCYLRTNLIETLARNFRRATVLVVCVAFGCKPVVTTPTIAEKIDVAAGDKVRLTLSSSVAGSLAQTPSRTEVATGRELKVRGEIAMPCAVGDWVSLHVEWRVDSKTWSTIANAHAKIESVKDGNGHFNSDLFIPDIKEQDARIRIAHDASASHERTELPSIDIHIRPPR